MPEKVKKERYPLIDELRGALVACLIVFHGACFGGCDFDIKPLYDFFIFFEPAAPYFASAFILLCGFCCVWSHSNLKRGALALAVGFGVTAVTWAVTFIGINELIVFGVLHFLGLALIIDSFLDKPLAKVGRVPALIAAAVCFFLFLFTYDLPLGYLGFSGNIRLPAELYRTNWFLFLGFTAPGFSAPDYFPLLPWLFMFFTGRFIGCATKGVLPETFKKSRVKPLAFLGRHSLMVYIVHQPIWFLIFTVIDLIRG